MGGNDGVFYLTTPIYYVNDVPHLGHAYTTVAGDALAIHHRLAGKRVLFLTGTDEHGKKVEQAAAGFGETPQQLADRVVLRFKDLWAKLGITNDDFIRTTEPRHRRAVQALFSLVKEKGDIYLGEYEDWYCVPCESFWTDAQAENGVCPDCRRGVEKVKESSYFFRLSAYADRLLAHYREHPDFVFPSSRMNEVVSFVEGGLRDLSISRTSLTWGIPVPDDPAHIIYVWFDALTNYLAAAGYPDDQERFTTFWPADLHLVGKDIIRFHAVYWPAFLLSAGLPLPKRIFAHGWWTVEGEKMSKSLGNVVDPGKMVEEHGVDAVRYFLLREVPFGLDGDYSTEAFRRRYNVDLANDLGNLVNRILGMAFKYRDGLLAAPSAEGPEDAPLAAEIAAAVDDYHEQMGKVALHRAVEAAWAVVGAGNRYVDKTAPWALAKSPESAARLDTVLYQLADLLRIVAILASPIIPGSAAAMTRALGIEGRTELTSHAALRLGLLPFGTQLVKIPALFPRIETPA
jgi:methionyl-tRNA synthetase